VTSPVVIVCEWIAGARAVKTSMTVVATKGVENLLPGPGIGSSLPPRERHDSDPLGCHARSSKRDNRTARHSLRGPPFHNRMSEVVARFIPVLSCTAVTAAFGITAWEASLTTPESPAVCAAAVREETRNKKIKDVKYALNPRAIFKLMGSLLQSIYSEMKPR